MKVEVTGRENREDPWKVAICGFGGAGKTLFASTATSPLFLFFTSHPKIKSIADRAVPHVKLYNEFDGEGHVLASSLDKLQAVLTHLELQDHSYDTLVLDTGDELFQSMKEARRAQNYGEFGPGDWGWLADTYREVMQAVLEADMDVLVLYHIKNATLEDGLTYRELLLQGSIVDEVAGWFDVVGVMDTFEVPSSEGEAVTRRALLTHSSRLYPWVKDHSGSMPRRFEISTNFMGDWPRMRERLVATEDELPSVAVVDDIESVSERVVEDDVPVPSPEELVEKKQASLGDAPSAPSDEAGSSELPAPSEAPEPSPDEASISSPVEDHGEVASEEQGELPVSVEEATVNVVEQLGGTEVEPEPEVAEPVAVKQDPDAMTCVVDGNPIDQGIGEVSYIRFRRHLCKAHYEQLRKAGGDWEKTLAQLLS